MQPRRTQWPLCKTQGQRKDSDRDTSDNGENVLRVALEHATCGEPPIKIHTVDMPNDDGLLVMEAAQVVHERYKQIYSHDDHDESHEGVKRVRALHGYGIIAGP